MTLLINPIASINNVLLFFLGLPHSNPDSSLDLTYTGVLMGIYLTETANS